MIAVVGVPFDEFSSFRRGPARAPDKIREAFHSDSSNYFTERRTNLKEHAGWRDAGNLTLPSGKEVTGAIERGISEVLKSNDKILSLGGDHSVSYPIIKAVAQKYGKLSILHLDAHSDLYDEFEGNRYSHACPFARVMEEGLASRLVQVGIRTLNEHQHEQATRFGVEIIEMRNWNQATQFQFNGPIYISLDMDVLDPAYAPGISHYEPGGMTTRELLSLIQRVSGNVVGADLVEFNPERDINDMTAMVAGKLFKELLDVLIKENG